MAEIKSRDYIASLVLNPPRPVVGEHFALSVIASLYTAGMYSVEVKGPDGSCEPVEFELFSVPPNTFRKKGDYWEIRYAGGEPFLLKDCKGARYIYLLLRGPEVKHHAVNMYYVMENKVKGLLAFQKSWEDAERQGDVLGTRDIEADARKYLLRNSHHPHKRRFTPADAEKCRKAVSNSIRRTLEKIKESDLGFYQHLKESLHLGGHFQYKRG